MERGFTPSTPAVRPPLLLRTRSQATTRNAGSQTRLNRETKRRSDSSFAHRCSLAWMLSPRDQASSRSGHGPSVFTGDLLTFQPFPASLLPSLAMWPAFPASDYYEGSAPPWVG